MTKFAKPIRAALCAALALQSVQAAQANADCIPPIEAEALVLTIAPILVGEMVTTCTGVLATDSYLLSRGPDLAKRFEAAAADREELAFSAFKRLGDGNPDESQSTLVRAIFKQELAKTIARDLKAKDCPGMDELFASLDPLPPTNFAKALVAIIRLAEADRKPTKSASKKKGGSGAVLCPTSTTP